MAAAASLAVTPLPCLINTHQGSSRSITPRAFYHKELQIPDFSANKFSLLGNLSSRSFHIGVKQTDEGTWKRCISELEKDDSYSHKRRSNIVRASRNREDSNTDDDGVIRDMERYLNDLSIEYDSVWDTKPAWCQPWTIILTGVIGVSASWLLFHWVVLTVVLSLLVAAWWFIFLYSYPMSYTEMIAQRRKDQRDGVEDTFGTKQSNN